jgi:hypothetical protein
MDDLPMQCAWCRRRYDGWGLFGEPLPVLLAEVSHGLCIVCLSKLLSDRVARYRREGDVERADLFERKRTVVLRAFLQRRSGARTSAQRRRFLDSLCLLVRIGQLTPPRSGDPETGDYDIGARVDGGE